MMEDMHTQYTRSSQLMEAKVQRLEEQVMRGSEKPSSLADMEEAKSTAGKPAPFEQPAVEAKRMPMLTLGTYSGTKYDGSPDKFSQWDDSIRSHLTAHGMRACINDVTFQGRDINGDRIEPGAFLNALISEAADRQSAVGAYIAQSLTGTLATKVSRLQKELDEKAAAAPPRPGARITLSAFEIYAFVKKEANPTLAFKTRGQVDKLYRQDKLAPRADRVAVDKYIEEKRSHWDYLNRTGGGEDVLSEHSLVAQILAGMEEHHESARRVLENASQTPTGKYSLVQLQGAIDGQFPKDYSQKNPSTAYMATGKCGICGMKGHETANCYRNPDQTCAKCGVKGHHANICGREKKPSQADRKKQKEKKEKDQAKKKVKAEKRDRDKAYIELGKAKEAELMAASKKTAVAFNIASPAPNAPAAAPASAGNTKSVMLESGITVSMPDRVLFIGAKMGAVERISSVFPTAYGIDGMKAGCNSDAITSLMDNKLTSDNSLINALQDNPDVSLNNTNSDEAPDLLEVHVDFQSNPNWTRARAH